MKCWKLAALVVLALATGCEEEPAPVAAAAPAAKKPDAKPGDKKDEKKADEKKAETAPLLEYAYTPVGKRDPFRSFLDDVVEKGDENARPDCPLCKWELEQLKLVAVISGISNPLGMVEDPQGRGYVVRRGTFMGKRNGKVTQIRTGELVVSEIFKDQMGKPHINPVIIKLPAEKAMAATDDQNLLGPEVAE